MNGTKRLSRRKGAVVVVSLFAVSLLLLQIALIVPQDSARASASTDTFGLQLNTESDYGSFGNGESTLFIGDSESEYVLEESTVPIPKKIGYFFAGWSLVNGIIDDEYQSSRQSVIYFTGDEVFLTSALRERYFDEEKNVLNLYAVWAVASFLTSSASKYLSLDGSITNTDLSINVNSTKLSCVNSGQDANKVCATFSVSVNGDFSSLGSDDFAEVVLKCSTYSIFVLRIYFDGTSWPVSKISNPETSEIHVPNQGGKADIEIKFDGFCNSNFNTIFDKYSESFCTNDTAMPYLVMFAEDGSSIMNSSITARANNGSGSLVSTALRPYVNKGASVTVDDEGIALPNLSIEGLNPTENSLAVLKLPHMFILYSSITLNNLICQGGNSSRSDDVKLYANGYDLYLGEKISTDNVKLNGSASNAEYDAPSVSIIGGEAYPASMKLSGKNWAFPEYMFPAINKGGYHERGTNSTESAVESSCILKITGGEYARMMAGSRGCDGGISCTAEYKYGGYTYPSESGDPDLLKRSPRPINNILLIGGDARFALVCGGQTDNSMYGDSEITTFGNCVIFRIMGGTIGFTPAGNAQYQNRDYEHIGNVRINILDGYVHIINGGSAGRTITNVHQHGDVEINIIGGVVGGDSKDDFRNRWYEGGKYGDRKYLPSNDVGYPTVAIYGGSQAGTLTGSTESMRMYLSGDSSALTSEELKKIRNGLYPAKVELNILGGTINGDIFCGGKGCSEFTGNASSQVSALGTTKKIIDALGSRSSSLDKKVAYMFADVTVNIGNDTSKPVLNSTIYGGGEGYQYDSNIANFKTYYIDQGLTVAEFDGTVEINYYGHSGKINSIYGCGKGLEYGTYKNNTYKTAYMEVAKADDVKFILNVSTDLTTAAVYGGGQSSMVSSIETHISALNGSRITGNIYGGGLGVSGNVDVGKIVNDANLIVSGIVDGNIYGGGQLAKVYGNTFVKLGSSTITGNIFAGGKGEITDGRGSESVGETSHVFLFGKGTYYTYDIAEWSNPQITIGGKAHVFGTDTVGEFDHSGRHYSYSYSNGILTVFDLTETTPLTINGSVYGGSENGAVKESTVFVSGTDTIINGTVYGGGLGETDVISMINDRTVYIQSGTITGSIYGGSSNGDDGNVANLDSDSLVVIVAGEILGSVYGGGFQGTTNGNTDLRLGYAYHGDITDTHEEIVNGLVQVTSDFSSDMKLVNLTVSESLYGGGDVGTNADTSFQKVLVRGGAKIMVFGEENTVSVLGSILGSGNSCLNGAETTISLLHFGTAGQYAEVHAIHRADKVIIENSFIKVSGRVATAEDNRIYSLYMIGELVVKAGKDAGTQLDISERASRIKEYHSLNSSGGFTTPGSPQNILTLTGGSIFETLYEENDAENYGKIYGYTQLSIPDGESVYGGYVLGNTHSASIGGFLVHSDGEYAEMFKDMNDNCRCWYISGNTTVTSTLTIAHDPNIGSTEICSASNLVTLSRISEGELIYNGYFTDFTNSIYSVKPSLEDISGDGQIAVLFAKKTDDPDVGYYSDEGLFLGTPKGSSDEEKIINSRDSLMPQVQITYYALNPVANMYLGSVSIIVDDCLAVTYIGDDGTENITYVASNTNLITIDLYTSAPVGDGITIESSIFIVEDSNKSISIDSASVDISIPRSQEYIGKDLKILNASKSEGMPAGIGLTISPILNKGSTNGWKEKYAPYAEGSINHVLGVMNGAYSANMEFTISGLYESDSQDLEGETYTVEILAGDKTITFVLTLRSESPVTVYYKQDINGELSELGYGTYAYGTLITDSETYSSKLDNFVYWFDEATGYKFDLSTKLTGDLSLIAVEAYTVTLERGDEVPFFIVVESEDARYYRLDTDVTRFGYSFQQWVYYQNDVPMHVDYITSTPSKGAVIESKPLTIATLPSESGTIRVNGTDYTFRIEEGRYYIGDQEFVNSSQIILDGKTYDCRVVNGKNVLQQEIKLMHINSDVTIHAIWEGEEVQLKFVYTDSEGDHEFTPSETITATFGSIFGSEDEGAYNLAAVQKELKDCLAGSKQFIRWVNDLNGTVAIYDSTIVTKDLVVYHDGIYECTLTADLAEIAIQYEVSSPTHTDAKIDPPINGLLYSKTEISPLGGTLEFEFSPNNATLPGYVLQSWSVGTTGLKITAGSQLYIQIKYHKTGDEYIAEYVRVSDSMDSGFLEYPITERTVLNDPDNLLKLSLTANWDVETYAFSILAPSEGSITMKYTQELSGTGKVNLGSKSYTYTATENSLTLKYGRERSIEISSAQESFEVDGKVYRVSSDSGIYAISFEYSTLESTDGIVTANVHYQTDIDLEYIPSGGQTVKNWQSIVNGKSVLFTNTTNKQQYEVLGQSSIRVNLSSNFIILDITFGCGTDLHDEIGITLKSDSSMDMKRMVHSETVYIEDEGSCYEEYKLSLSSTGIHYVYVGNSQLVSGTITIGTAGRYVLNLVPVVNKIEHSEETGVEVPDYILVTDETGQLANKGAPIMSSLSGIAYIPLSDSGTLYLGSDGSEEIVYTISEGVFHSVKTGDIQIGGSFQIGEAGITYTYNGDSLSFTLFEFDGYGYESTMPVSEYIHGEPPFFTKYGISNVVFTGEISAYTTYVILNGGTVTGSAPVWDSDEGEEVYTTMSLLPEYNLFEFICVEYDDMALTGCTKIVDGQKIVYILYWTKAKHSAIGM